MSAYLEVIYVGDQAHAVQTGIGAEGKTDAWAHRAFADLKEHEIDLKVAPYIVDLWSDEDEVIDTVGISTTTFEQITGKAHRDWFATPAA